MNQFTKNKLLMFFKNVMQNGATVDNFLQKLTSTIYTGVFSCKTVATYVSTY